MASTDGFAAPWVAVSFVDGLRQNSKANIDHSLKKALAQDH
jgi:hypothetical protein